MKKKYTTYLRILKCEKRMQEVDEKLEMLRRKKAEALLKHQKMPESVIKVNSVEEFNKILKDYPDKIIIIDFWAVWCGPCMFFAPIFKKLHEEFQNDFIFLKVNVDENSSVAMKYQITGIPTTLFIKNGEVVNKIVGAMNYDGMKKVLIKLNS
ncbi:MAG: thioredoxin [Candidatus Lokiarchaeota archaeon]|nr:thioredoxin [Candidatus Lokiarchaeota archaeon]